MGALDDFLTNFKPPKPVNLQLFRLYIGSVVFDAQLAGMSEDELVRHLSSLDEYMQFLGNLNDIVVQEISDLSDELYGKLEGFD